MNSKLLCLPLLSLLTLASCGSISGGEEPASSQDDAEKGETLTLVSEGLSDYKIVIPEGEGTYLSLASSELSYFLQQSSSCKLDVVSEKSNPSKYISLGITSQLKSSPSYKEGEDYGLSGYRVYSENENIYIYGTSQKEKGTLYGVYDFLSETIGYEAYASDDYHFEAKERVTYLTKDEVVIPSFDTRSIGYKCTNSDSTLSTRLRLENQQGSDDWYGFGHSQINGFYFNVADREEKVASGEWQDDWFASASSSAAINQLCYTGGEKLVEMVANSIIDKIKAHSDITYFMFGQQDNTNFCSCERCTKAKQEWGCNTAGLQIAFMNDVIAICDKYLEENEPGREVRYVVFAYNETTSAPVKEEGGQYVPYSDKVIPNEHLYFYFAPIGTDFSSGLDNISNETYYKAIQGWNVLASGRILCYLYDINFKNYFLNFYNVNSAKNMYSLYKKFGVSYMYSQGPLDTSVPCFEEARVYIESKLMWDLSLDYEALLSDFLTDYYGPASNAIKEYWDLTFNACAEYSAGGSYIGGIYSAIDSTDLWSEALVGAFRRCFDAAYASISSLDLENPSLYQTLYKRLKKLELTVLFLELSNYSQYFSSDELAAKKSDFEKYCAEFGVTKSSEGGSLPNFD